MITNSSFKETELTATATRQLVEDARLIPTVFHGIPILVFFPDPTPRSRFASLTCKHDVLAVMNAEWVSISETDGDVALHSRKLYARGNGFERDAVDSYEEFHVSREIQAVSDETARTNGFYKFKSFIDDSIGNDYNKRVLYTPSGERFINWLIEEKTAYESENWDGLRHERCIKRMHPMSSRGIRWTFCPIEKRYIYEFEWMAEADVSFDYPTGSEPREVVKQIRRDEAEYMERLTDDIINQLSWYSKDGTHYIYILELLNVETRETWWYVGQSRALKNRLKTHIKDPPSPPRRSNRSFYVTDLYDVKRDGYESKEEALREERETYLEFAIEHETTNVLGGG